MGKLFLIILLFLSFTRCKQTTTPGWIDEQGLLNRSPNEWLSLGGNHLMQHYSPLNEINSNNVSELGYAWEYDARSPIGRVHRGLEATPIVVNGVMYTSGAWGFVYALDAKAGEGLWKYDPSVGAS